MGARCRFWTPPGGVLAPLRGACHHVDRFSPKVTLMKRVLLSVVLSSVIALPAMAALKEGDKAPDFKTQASLAGKSFTFSLKSALKKGPVVVYFYPSAYTGGCNIQAHTFAVNSEKFTAAGATLAQCMFFTGMTSS